MCYLCKSRRRRREDVEVVFNIRGEEEEEGRCRSSFNIRGEEEDENI